MMNGGNILVLQKFSGHANIRNNEYALALTTLNGCRPQSVASLYVGDNVAAEVCANAALNCIKITLTSCFIW